MSAKKRNQWVRGCKRQGQLLLVAIGGQACGRERARGRGCLGKWLCGAKPATALVSAKNMPNPLLNATPCSTQPLAQLNCLLCATPCRGFRVGCGGGRWCACGKEFCANGACGAKPATPMKSSDCFAVGKKARPMGARQSKRAKTKANPLLNATACSKPLLLTASGLLGKWCGEKPAMLWRWHKSATNRHETGAHSTKARPTPCLLQAWLPPLGLESRSWWWTVRCAHYLSLLG